MLYGMVKAETAEKAFQVSMHKKERRAREREKSLWFYLFAINVKEKYNILTIQDGLFPLCVLVFIVSRPVH